MIKSFLSLCLGLFLDTLACMVAFVAAAVVVWAALRGACCLFAAVANAIMAVRARLRRKEMYAHSTG